ncbi:hypothetical protein [Sphingobacterium thermophilum]|uniref:DUF4251 domain-containing protein n=1 Tax=Sphingobacterium thermophilum TaxID=768534 RepID=A0ABP8R4X3_9SPHI
MKKKLLKIALMFAVSLTCQEVAAQKIELKDIQGMTRKTLASIQSEMIAQDFSIANIFNDKLSATDSVVFKYGNSIYLSYKSKKKTEGATVSYSFPFKDLYINYCKVLESKSYMLLHTSAIPSLGLENIYYDKEQGQVLSLTLRHESAEDKTFYPSTYTLKVLSADDAAKLLKKHKIKLTAL